MNLLQRIRDDQLDARKSKATAKARVLTLLISDAERIGKDDGNRQPTDMEVVAVIKKHLNGVKECLTLQLQPLDKLAKELELQILTEYLPQQMNESQMISALQVLKTSTVNALTMPVIMGYFKSQYPGQYDGEQLSSLAQRFIQGKV
jgi:hypothetical protein